MRQAFEEETITLRKSEWEKLLVTDNFQEVKKILNAVKTRKENKLREKENKRNKALALCKKRLKTRANDFKKDLIANQTPSEANMKVILKSLNITYEFQKIYYTESTFYIADFYLPEHDIIIEVDGEYHNNKEQKLKDDLRTKELKERVSGIYRINNRYVEDITLGGNHVKEFIKDNRKKEVEKRMDNLTYKG